MFFFIGGIQPRTVSLGSGAQKCPCCGYYPLETKRIDHYLTVFFIPLFPIKKGKPFSLCPECNAGIRKGEDASADCRALGNHYCRFCHKLFSTEFSFCPYCGRPVE